MDSGFTWKCECGYIDHSDLPEDCPKCLAVGKFSRVQDDQLEEAVAEEVLAMNAEGEEDED